MSNRLWVLHGWSPGPVGSHRHVAWWSREPITLDRGSSQVECTGHPSPVGVSVESGVRLCNVRSWPVQVGSPSVQSRMSACANSPLCLCRVASTSVQRRLYVCGKSGHRLRKVRSPSVQSPITVCVAPLHRFASLSRVCRKSNAPCGLHPSSSRSGPTLSAAGWPRTR